jgi:PTS system ascorbate-specific IIC component
MLSILNQIGTILVNQVLTKTEIVMSLISLIGLILLKKPIEKIVTGVIKTYIGVAMFSLGLNAVQDAVGVFTSMFCNLLAGGELRQAIQVPVNFDVLETSAAAGYMLLIGYVVNILIARFTKIKIIYLTGHWSYFMGQFLAACLMNYLGIIGPQSIIIGGIILGIYQAVFPYIVQPYTRKLTGNDNFALGHGASFFALIGAWLGSKIGDPEKSCEDINVPDRLSFLKEIVVSLSLTMIIMYVALAVANGRAYVDTLAKGQNWILFAVFQGLKFTASYMVLLYGIRAFLSEITPAFQGISTRLVPGAIPAFDAPVFFQYGNTSLILGFITSTIFSALGMVLLMKMNLPVPIMMLNVENFFGGGLVAIYANKFGGRRAAIICSALYGFVVTITRALYFPMITPQLDWAQTACDADQMVVITLTGWIGKLFGLAKYAW